jgi:hypothetical protein
MADKTSVSFYLLMLDIFNLLCQSFALLRRLREANLSHNVAAYDKQERFWRNLGVRWMRLCFSGSIEQSSRSGGDCE